ncbi:patatin-like phospholipase family protein [Bradyrhizobium sp. STM 3562]|uniref:patatin-like phospholipase family protein n=1 Tax=Bradyrhizobium sp. STM 3562 TaxID=578924 RepID=UPI00388E8438
MTNGRSAQGAQTDQRRPKRAIALAGGGPAAGLHLGVLKFLEGKKDANGNEIEFDVWALSCIGAWVGIVYNQFDKEDGRSRADRSYEFFRNSVFRDDASYSRFPINTVFGPDWFGNSKAMWSFLTERASYENLVLPAAIMESVRHTISFFRDPKNWTDPGDVNQWVLNHVLAVNPFVRLLTSLMYRSDVSGLSKIYYPNSNFLKAINFEKLYDDRQPYIYHNAWRLTGERGLQLFSNKLDQYKDIDAASLCACSALPFVEQTVAIDGDTYCEGALVDTVNFENLLADHRDLDEIWISRIVDAQQIREPKDLHDSLANLCQLFAATVGEDDVRLFKYHVAEDNRTPGREKWNGTIVEIRVDSKINFDWSHENLRKGWKHGERTAKEAYQNYLREWDKQLDDNGLRVIIGETPTIGVPEVGRRLADLESRIQKLEPSPSTEVPPRRRSQQRASSAASRSSRSRSRRRRRSA